MMVQQRSNLTSHRRRSGVDRRMVRQIEAAACWAQPPHNATYKLTRAVEVDFFTFMPPQGWQLEPNTEPEIINTAVSPQRGNIPEARVCACVKRRLAANHHDLCLFSYSGSSRTQMNFTCSLSLLIYFDLWCAIWSSVSNSSWFITGLKSGLCVNAQLEGVLFWSDVSLGQI